MIITRMLGPSYVVIFVVAQKIVTLPNDLAFKVQQQDCQSTACWMEDVRKTYDGRLVKWVAHVSILRPGCSG
jgi:hypothetical protein